MKLYPINLDINDKLCVVVGSGIVATRKTQSLLDAGAKVKIINGSGVRGSEFGENVEIIERDYKKGDLKGAYLAIAATNDKKVNAQVAKEAREEKVLLNVVDKPALCDYYVPSIVKRGDLVISISTSGKYPALSKKIRKELEEQFGPEYGPYLELLAQRRNKEITKNADLRLSEEQRKRKT